MLKSYLACFCLCLLESITIPLQSVDLYIWYDWLDMEWSGEFTLLFSSEEDPISGACKPLAFEWGKSQ